MILSVIYGKMLTNDRSVTIHRDPATGNIIKGLYILVTLGDADQKIDAYAY